MVDSRTNSVDSFSAEIISRPSTTDLSSKSPADTDKASLKGTQVFSTTTVLDDTIHYLSPASPISPRTEHEGGYDYQSPSFMQLLQYPADLTYASISTISCIEPELQRTLAIVKPEAMKYEDVIVREIIEAGFSILRTRHLHLTPEQVSEVHAQYYGSPAFPQMVVSMSIGPILVLCLSSINAVSKWKELVGPEHEVREEWFFPMSMRVRFGLHEPILNALHASETLTESNKENRYVNPESIIEPIIMEEKKVIDYCGLYVNPTLLEGLVEIVRVKPVDPVLYLAEWLLKNNPFQPRLPPDVAMLPT